MKIDYIFKTLAVVCMTIENARGGPINDSINFTKALPSPRKSTSNSSSVNKATKTFSTPTSTISKINPTLGDIFNYSLKVPLFNSTESNSSDSDESYLTLNYIRNKKLDKYGYGISTMDERYEACRDKFVMKDIYYKIYCDSTCEYTPKFDLGTCRLVCDKFKNNAECLNNPSKYYFVKGFQVTKPPGASAISNKIMIIDSNKSIIPSRKSYVIIEKVISDGRITYYNVESNDDRVSSCSRNKNLKEIFLETKEYSSYCGFGRGNIIFDVATCTLGCGRDFLREKDLFSDPEDTTSIAINPTETISDSTETIYESESILFKSEEITSTVIESTKTISDSTETIYESESIPFKTEEITSSVIESTKTILDSTKTFSDPTETIFESNDIFSDDLLPPPQNGPSSQDSYSEDPDDLPPPPQNDPSEQDSYSEDPDDLPKVDPNEDPESEDDSYYYNNTPEFNNMITSIKNNNIIVKSVKVPLFNSAKSDSTDSNSYITLSITRFKDIFNTDLRKKYIFRVDYTDKRYEECVDKFTLEDIDYNFYCGQDCQYTPKFDLNTCQLVCDKFKNNDECLKDPHTYYFKEAKPYFSIPGASVTNTKVMIIDSNESSTSKINNDAYATIEKVSSRGEITYYNVESNDDRVYSCGNNKDLKRIFPKSIDYSRYCGFGRGHILFDVATCKLKCEIEKIKESESDE
jgi:hypothetical protein